MTGGTQVPLPQHKRKIELWVSEEIISYPKEKMSGCKISVAHRDADMNTSWGLYAIRCVTVSPILNGTNFHLVTSTVRTLILSLPHVSPLFTCVLISTWMVRSDSLSLCPPFLGGICKGIEVLRPWAALLVRGHAASRGESLDVLMSWITTCFLH